MWRAPGTAWLLAAAGLTAGAFFVFRGALSYYFTQDDFKGLAVASGVLPPQTTVWRYVSQQLFMDVCYPLFGAQPWPYHFVSLVLHSLNAVLLFSLLARWLAPSAAFVAASFFVTHPTLFTALYWISARSDVLATTFALCTVALAMHSGWARWLALPSYALSLLSKESMLMLPVVLVFLQRWRSPGSIASSGKLTTRVPERQAVAAPTLSAAVFNRDWLVPALLLLGATFFFYLFGARQTGIGATPDPTAPYSLDVSPVTIIRNALTYIGWTTDLPMLQRGLRFVDVVNPALFPVAIGAAAAWGLGALEPALRRRGWIVGGAIFVLFLMPVLPLRNHTYHYYLYGPLTGAALCVAALCDAGVRLLMHWSRGKLHQSQGRRVATADFAGRQQMGVVAWTVAVIISVGLAMNGKRLVTRMETRPLRVHTELRADPTVGRALVARELIEGLRRTSFPAGTELVLILRERLALLGRISLGSRESPPPNSETYPETNARAALLDGLGIRVLVPNIATVRFTLHPGQSTQHELYVVYAPTGEVEVFSLAEVDSLLGSSWVNRW